MVGKKDFKSIVNPAMAYITQPTEEVVEVVEAPVKEAEVPEGYKLNPMYIETKSKRVQLLLQPSVVEKVKELAKENGLSMNELINTAIIEYLQKEGR